MTLPVACFSAEDFRDETNVSHETLDRLKIFAALLERWQAKMNLVGPGSMDEMWRRHFFDSAQLLPLVRAAHPDSENLLWLDLGSGAGFPGLVLAILGAGEVHLVESNGRKCAFLRQVIRETGAAAVVHNARSEDLPAMKPDVITSRALGDVEKILELGEKFLGAHTEIWLHKGQHIEKELTRATISWIMQVEKHPSRSDPSGTILCLKGIQRVENRP
ncbi:MAG: 16S rRNA (guanine(527)-N(7))-methyltransferase RsmG [Proteobacteria bacterium]|nr:16S rRNA (guanine(527)-N(7))-methyltransferase RsmG [Pseudomonadota bacterium]